MLKTTLFSLASICCLGVFAPSANALEFSFSQVGFIERNQWNGTLTGEFAGIDGNGDNILDESEMTNFLFEWSGNGIVGQREFGTDDLVNGIRFDLVSKEFLPTIDRQLFRFFWEEGEDDFDVISGFGLIPGRGNVFSTSARVLVRGGAGGVRRTTSFINYTIEGTSSPNVVPTPAAVLPGLIGMGLSAIRKRKEKA